MEQPALRVLAATASRSLNPHYQPSVLVAAVALGERDSFEVGESAGAVILSYTFIFKLRFMT